MKVTKCMFAGLAASLVMCATATYAADEGLTTKPSKYSAKETVARFEAAVKQREAAGFMSQGLPIGTQPRNVRFVPKADIMPTRSPRRRGRARIGAPTS